MRAPLLMMAVPRWIMSSGVIGAIVGGLLGAIGAGCTEPRSTACKEVCKREAECVDTTGNKLPFDEKECIAACAALEHDVEHSAAKVQRHMECVTKQPTCSGVLECK